MFFSFHMQSRVYFVFLFTWRVMCTIFFWFTYRGVSTIFQMHMQSCGAIFSGSRGESCVLFVWFICKVIFTIVYFWLTCRVMCTNFDSLAESWVLILIPVHSRVQYFSGSHGESCVLFFCSACKVVWTFLLFLTHSRVDYY